MARVFWMLLLAPVLVLPARMPAYAQGGFAAVTGQITDPQGSAIPNAKVTLRAPITGLLLASTASPEGLYEFAGVKPGDYELEAGATGFSTQVTKLTLEVNQHLRLDVQLSLGAMNQEVRVVATSELLRRSDASLGEVIEPTMTAELPLNGRHLLDLALGVPGAHMGHGAQTGETNPLYWRPGQNSALSVGGNRPNANYFTLDASTDTDPTFNTLSFSPSPDAVQEFKVQTGSYSAEFGGAGGAQVNIVTQSGNNRLHGDVYEFLRNGAFDARAFNEDMVPHLVQNQFGAAAGGPIRKDKTFLFAHFEGFRASRAMTMVDTVPTLAERSGDFSQSGTTIFNPFSSQPNPNFDPSKPTGPGNAKVFRDPFAGNVIPIGLLSPVATQVLALIPLPNLPSQGKLDSNNFLDVRTERQSTNQGNVRVDHSFGDSDRMFVRYSIQGEDGFTPQNLPGFGAFNDNLAQNATVSYTHVFSPQTVNIAWIGVSRLSMHRFSENNLTNDYVTQLGIQGVGFGGQGAWGLPWFAVQGYSGIGDSFAATPVQAWDTVLQAGDAWNKQISRHSLKIGGDYRRLIWPMWGFFQNRGFYQFTNGFTTRTATNDRTGSGLASFLLGLPVVKQRQAGIPQMNLRQWYASAYVQDDWRLTDTTTLNIGVRYEYMSALADTRIPGSNLEFVNGQPQAFVGDQLGRPRGLWYPNRLNFAPRFGFAHTVKGRLGFVVRGAFGTFFTPVDMNTWCNQRHNVPYVFPETQQSDNFNPSLQGFNFGPAVLGQTRVSFAAFPPRSPSQYINQWSFSVEKALAGDTVLEIGYQGSRGFHLQRSHLINNAAPGPGPINPRRPFASITFLPGTDLGADNAQQFQILSSTFPVSAINLLENSARSWYDAGWVNARRRFRRGLSFLVNYTWSKNLSDAPDFRSPMFESAIPQDNSDLRAEKGPACDIRHRLAVSLVYDLPGLKSQGLFRHLTSNWRLATIYQVQSGFPFTVSVFGDTANAGTLLGENPVRADVTGAPVFPEGTHTTDRWLNPAAFAAPAAFQFGNAGRNSVFGPGMQVLDTALTREFSISEQWKLQFRTELFNALNHSNLDSPNRFVNTPQFASITEAMTPGREMQFSARLVF